MLSVDYPSDKDRSKFVKKAGPHAKNSNPFHKPLAASATDDEWRRVLRAIKESVKDASFLHEQSSPRPLRPNDDNYEAFTGRKWKPEVSLDFGGRDPSVVRALSAMMGQQDDTNTPYPRYDRCANCTKLLPKMSRCSRCKIVKYCSRDCQSSHWKKVHKQSCVKAQPFALYKSMNGNDGFLMTPDECKGLAEALSEHESIHSDNVVRCFQAYFTVAADLGGCFILWNAFRWKYLSNLRSSSKLNTTAARSNDNITRGFSGILNDGDLQVSFNSRNSEELQTSCWQWSKYH